MKKIRYNKTYVMINVIKNNLKIKQGDYEENRSLYTFIGINLLGERTVLGLYLDKANDNRFFMDILEEFKAKGIEKIYFIVCLKEDKLCKGIKVSYPNATIISSLTMTIVNLWSILTERGRGTLVTKIKNIYVKDTYEEAKASLELLKEYYQDNPLVLMVFNKYLNDIETYYQYDKDVRTFLFNHNSYTNLWDIIKRKNEIEEFKNLENISNSLNGTFDNIEKNRLYTKNQWTNILNHCNNYYSSILDEALLEI